MQKPNYELLDRVGRRIAQECAMRGGSWQVTFEELAKVVGEKGKLEKLYRTVNKLAEQGIITIEKSPSREPNTYRYVNKDYTVNPEYVQLASMAKQVQDIIVELIKRIDKLQERDERMSSIIKNLSFLDENELGTVYVFNSKESIEELCHKYGI